MGGNSMLRHDRVLSWMYLKHCFLPSTLGALARSRPTLRGTLEHDDRIGVRDGRCHGHLLPRRHVHNVVRSHYRHVRLLLSSISRLNRN